MFLRRRGRNFICRCCGLFTAAYFMFNFLRTFNVYNRVEVWSARQRLAAMRTGSPRDVTYQDRKKLMENIYLKYVNFTDATEDMLYPLTSDPNFDNDVDTLNLAPIPFLPTYKNPCWFEPLHEEVFYDANKNHTFGALWADFYKERISPMIWTFKKRLETGQRWRIRCLPYFYVPGISKCGTTDLYGALRQHPDVAHAPMKEPIFWNRIRMETPQVEIGWLARVWEQAAHIPTPKPIVHYLDAYDKTAEIIRKSVRVTKDADGTFKEYHHKITGDASPSYLFDFDGWTKLPINKGRTEPLFTIADIIAQLTPNAKIIIIVRNPTDRLFSDYKFYPHGGKKSPRDFHKKATLAIDKMDTCLSHRSVRSCIYDRNLTSHSMPLRLRVGMYEPFLQDWLKVFPRENILITRLEDYGKDREKVLKDMFELLGLRPVLSNQNEMPVKNQSFQWRSLKGGMRNKTRLLIDEFYRSWNHKLANLLGNDKYTYGL